MDQLVRLDHLPFSRWHYMTVMALGVSWLFDGYEVSSLVVSSQVLKHALHMENKEYFLISSFYMIGCAIGGWLFAILSFFFGRKSIFTTTLAVYSLSILLVLAAKRVELILLSRFIAGLSVGGEYTAIMSAISEFIPTPYRGRTSVFVDGSWHLGSIFAALVSIIFNNIFVWKVMFGMGLFAVIPLFILRKHIPQSPRWLITKNRQLEALYNISLIENAVRDQSFLIRSTNLQISQIQSGTAAKINFSQILETFWNVLQRYPARLCLVAFLISSQSMYFTCVYYKYPLMLVSKGVGEQQVGIYFIPLSVASLLGCGIIGSFFDITSRRVMCYFLFCASGIFLICLNFAHLTVRQLSLYMGALFFFASPAASCAGLSANELFPSNSRTLIMAAMYSINMLGGVAGMWIESLLVSGVIIIVAGCLAYIFGVDSENKTLEQIQQLS